MRCYIEPERWSSGQIEIEGEELHHLAHVIRAKEGEVVELTDGAGHQARARLISRQRKVAVLEVEQQAAVPPHQPALTLIQALPREQKFELILQKAVELGVTEIYPVLTDHSVVRLRKEDDEAKRERWSKIAINAMKQCGSAWLPRIHPVSVLADLLPSMPGYDLLLTCSLAADALPLREVLRGHRATPPRTIACMVGPEGDFTSRETSAARNAGARMVSLGSLVLRTETAALYILSALNYEFSPGAPPP